MSLDAKTIETIREHAEALAEQAPPLSAATRDRLAGLLRQGPRATPPERARPLRIAA